MTANGEPAREWHAMTPETAAARMETDLHGGLASDDAARRLRVYGPNVITPRRGPGPLHRFLTQFHQPLVYILIAAGVVTLALREFVDSMVIFGVVLVNALVGFAQEAKALQAIAALGKTLVTEATVVRGGRKLRVGSAEVVPGDLVLLQSGDKVPADLRLVQCRDLKVSEAALTGESIPVDKAPDALPGETPLADRRNIAFGSTLVAFGQGAGLVIETGDRTEVGRISRLIATATDVRTPLTRRISEFSQVLLYTILGLAALNFSVGLSRGRPAQEMFVASVALAVAAIPEGLPAAVTITLAIGVARMARRRAIVRRLPAVETLGSTTVICSDKTGTLTENQMTVVAAAAAGERFTFSGTGYDPSGHVVGPLPNAALIECLRAGLLCNDSLLLRNTDGWEIQGDPTEGALIVAAAKADIDATATLAASPRVDSVPFESERQYMATLHDRGPGRTRLLYVKGSVESIIQKSTTAMDAAGTVGALHVDNAHALAAELASGGLRVLAMALKEVPETTTRIDPSSAATGLVFLGLQAMIDPPRPEAIAAVAACERAGIRVKMITGDHAATAVAIAKKLGLGDGEKVGAVTGAQIAVMSKAELTEAAERSSVFARVAPEQKLRLVQALQSRGNVVAMTGDGVNDAPALKQANIGIAMGRGGTEVARESADMVLTDDNFASIEAAVEEGRGIFDNLTKFIVWTLPTNIGEGLIVLVAVLLGAALPIAPVQILWVNMMSAVTLGLMLAFEPKEPDIMGRRPRDPRAPLLNYPLIKRLGFVSMLILAGVFGIYEWMLARGATISEARTAAVAALVVVEIFYLFNCRSLARSAFHIGLLTNRPALLGAAGMLALQILFSHWGPMNALFHTAPISAEAWAAVFLVGVAFFLAVEAEKRAVGHVLRGTSK